MSKATSTIPQPLTFRRFGHVYDCDTRQPIEGAIVTVHREFSSGAELESTAHRTDSHGKFEFDISPDLQRQGMYLQIDVEHEDYAALNGYGYSYAMTSTNEELGEPPFFSKFFLRPAAKVTGRVVDPSGKPVEDAQVKACWALKEPGEFRSTSYLETTTDSAGRFSVNLCKGELGYIWIATDDDAIKQIELEDVKSADVGVVQLAPGVAVQGRVLDAEGNPLAGIPLLVRDVDGQAECSEVGSCSVRQTESDDLGNFSLNPVASGKHVLEISPYRSNVANNRATKIELPGVFVPIEIEVPPCADQPGFDTAGNVLPVDVQAEPHVVFTGRAVNSAGEPKQGHLPSFHVKLAGEQTLHCESRHGVRTGEFSALVPQSAIGASVSLTTSEHSAFVMEFGGKKTSHSFYHELEDFVVGENYSDLRITWFDTTLLLVDVVNQSGNRIPAGVSGNYLDLYGDIHFVHQSDGTCRSHAIVPGYEFELEIWLPNNTEQPSMTRTLTLEEGEVRKEVVVVDG